LLVLTLTAHLMLDVKRSRNFSFLSHLSISFIFVGFRQYGARVLFRFSFAFILGSIEGRLQRLANSFLALT
jgi:hypothetical protein